MSNRCGKTSGHPLADIPGIWLLVLAPQQNTSPNASRLTPEKESVPAVRITAGAAQMECGIAAEQGPPAGWPSCHPGRHRRRATTLRVPLVLQL